MADEWNVFNEALPICDNYLKGVQVAVVTSMDDIRHR